MRHLLAVVLFIQMAVLCHAEGVATWLRTVYDFGSFKEETGKVSCVMKFINTGDSALRVTNVRSTCGCTASSYTLSDVAPGDTGVVTLTYNPVGRPGRFDKNVYVYTDGIPNRSTLTIKGNVIGSPETIHERYPISVGALSIEQRIMPFGKIIKGKSRTRYIGVYNRSEDSIKAVFSNIPRHIRVEMIPETVKPGEQATITVTYHSGLNDEWGLVQDTFTMETGPASGYSSVAVAGITHIDVTAVVNEDFSVLSKKEKAKAAVAEISDVKIDFGKISRVGECIKKNFKITNRGKSELKIRRIYTLDEGVEIFVDKNEIKPGKTINVEIRVNPEKQGDMLNAKVLVLTNDPDNSEQTVRLVGQMIENNNTNN